MITNGNFDTAKPTALVLGRFQPFHEGHLAVIQTAAMEVGQVCIACRNTPRDANNPFTYDKVVQAMLESHGLDPLVHCVIQVPNITRIVFGRRPGYSFGKVELPPEIEAISATALREKARGLLNG